jgi:UDP-N-acetylmuramate--alanine ligase
MIKNLDDIKHFFFIGVAGSGMSAIAQYLRGTGKRVSGSDRFFNENKAGDIKEKLEAEGIDCFLQNGSGITKNVDLVVASTAVEDSVIEIKKAKELNIPIMRRSELLAFISDTKKTIAVGGTSGKSTTTAMLFDIMTYAGLSPSIISGAGLVSLIEKGKIGNAFVGKSDWLLIEADESDGSIVQYHPEIGLLLNVEKDHKEMDELMRIFSIFQQNAKHFVVNRSNEHSKMLSVNSAYDFESEGANGDSGYIATDFFQHGFEISFQINKVPFTINISGKHNMENATGAAATAALAGVPLYISAEALKKYKGIYRRSQVLGNKNGVWVVDDFAHNPVKCAAAIRAAQPVSEKVIAWFQPHGYTPTKFLREDFAKEISEALRPDDEIWMSEIFYAGGTTTKDISAEDLINDIKSKNKNAFFIANRNHFLETVQSHFTKNCVLLMMGARDPSLEAFVKETYEELTV